MRPPPPLLPTSWKPTVSSSAAITSMLPAGRHGVRGTAIGPTG